MIIKIRINKKEIEHLKECDSYTDSCSTVQDLIRQIKQKIKKHDGK